MPHVQQYPALDKLVQAGVALTSTQSLEQVLQVLVDTAREMVDARYAAIGVLDPSSKRIADFVTSGISAEQRALLPARPVGHGVLGLLMRDPRPLHLQNISAHPESVGLPPGHPAMSSLLGVPVIAKHRVFGNLYVTEKADGDDFSDIDLALLQMLASFAAAAIENTQLRQERDRFFAAASHELGNAVAGVRLWAEHLVEKTKDAPPDCVEGLQRIRKGAEHAHRLIDDLLSLARIQEGRLTLAPWPVDVSALMLEVAEQYSPEIDKAGLRIDTSNVERGTVVSVDAARLRQIFVNLVSNAMKFTHPGTTISVGVRRHGAKGMIGWVADQGPGVAAEDAERIFRPYEQVSGLARGRGAGLGLPLSRQLARLMGGDLRVECDDNKGATFTVEL